jgi:hypothetical protein
MFMYDSYSIITKVFYFFSNLFFNVFIKTQFFFMKCLDLDTSNFAYFMSNERIMSLEKSYSTAFVEDKTVLGFVKVYFVIFSIYLFFYILYFFL